MKIEAGKYYRTRDGRKVGSMAYMPEGRHSEFPWVDPEGNAWKANGQFSLRPEGHPSSNDLIAEWTDDPASKPSPFVMRREFVPGVYGAFSVGPIDSMNRLHVMQGEAKMLTADELDEAAHLFAQFAEYLRETK